MWTRQDKCLLRVKWLYTVRRWKRLNLDSLVQSYGFFLLVGFFWYLCFRVVSRLCENIYSQNVIGPIILHRIVAFGYFAILIVVSTGHILTAYSSLFRGRDLPTLFGSPYPLDRLYRVQCLETLFLGGWVSGLFCLPIVAAYGWELEARWWFYPIVLVGLIGFLVICGAIGILIILSIARWLVGRPLRTAIGSILSIAGLMAVVSYTAMTKLAMLDNIEAAKLGETLANMRLSSSPYIPSQWMAELMASARTDDFRRAFLYLFLLWANALFLWNLVAELGMRWYSDAWLWSQERIGLFKKRREGRRFRRKRLWITKLFPRRIGPIVYKELHVFARDFSQWGQLALILSLILFYMAHTQNITFDEPQTRARSQLAFFNVILLGFIQATLSLRYTFPSISLEGRAFWTVKSSAIGIGRFFFTKYYLHTAVLLAIGEGMGLMLNHIIGVDPALNVVCAFVLFLFSFGFTSWSLGFGAIFHKFEAVSAAEVTSDTGALVAMILTLMYFGISVAFLARFALDHTPGTDIVGQLALEPEMILYATIFLLIQTCAILFPAAYGLKKLEEAVL
ncbi:MAG: hypothetical protein AB1656_23485 [Candidatus Omnitrophota bacterium]